MWTMSSPFCNSLADCFGFVPWWYAKTSSAYSFKSPAIVSDLPTSNTDRIHAEQQRRQRWHKKKKKTRNRLPLTARHCRGYPTRMLVHFPDHPIWMSRSLTARHHRGYSTPGTTEIIRHQAPLRLFNTGHH